MATYSALQIRRIAQNAEALFSIFRRVRPTDWIDRAATDLDAWVGRELSRLGVSPSMAGYKGYPANSCISANDVVVHGVPTTRPFVRGDIFTLDIAGRGGGWMADSAWTFAMPGASERAVRTIQAAWTVLRAVAGIVRSGISVREIAECAEEAAGRAGASVVPQFAGHGIGRELHEAPQIPFVTNGASGRGGYLLDAGEVISIEPVITLGAPVVACGEDGWDCRTDDRSPAAHFEITVVAENDGCRVLGLGGTRGTDLPARPVFG